ncbi:MAG: c-type cytochrome [Acidobacteriia bacterium]|nr:c-type cytochrome [Terriglobia bacterium]
MRTFTAVFFITAATAIAQNSAGDGQKLIQASDCSSCHAVDHQIVGPAYSDIAARYAGKSDAVEKLTVKIRDGGNGMTPHADLTAAQRRAMVAWILKQTPLTQKGTASPTASQQYTYKLKTGGTTQLDFAIFVDGKAGKVTKQVFHGYQLYNSYCYRCHGTDANGGELGPDLRHSLTAGMKRQQFLSVAMSGRKDKGMPAWAGFLSEEDVTDIFRYVKGRSLDLVPSGRPPSEQD